ncbi:hypothetical protein BU25DRAFT_456978 [Macroventuria anomochaeta]|uniref:Uncharacterized protein n=1 Tax=Macroventuria anomochaeta TaxID=301207 RepID=A0ACB6S4W5_9PLEO|nr:uncharacterized protein BU25DRAFT_456978 [Macroventuria anomochaeta]KAF2629301.1 hypothetical protein BU25DRAFT_456978 [Macroventuria anomochaeta]
MGPPRLPRPDPPPRFEGWNRAQLNDWIWGCERFFTPENGLTTGLAQTTFASGYLGVHQIDRWERAIRASSTDPTRWDQNRTWADLKATMLESLGTYWERVTKTRECVRNAKQRGHTPSELLDYLKTQWEEINPDMALDDNDKGHINDFYIALDYKIRARLELAPVRWLSLV